MRSLPLPAVAKRRNLISSLKIDLSSSALKNSVLNCAQRPISVTASYAHK